MIDRPQKMSSAETAPQDPARSRLIPELGMMAGALWNSPVLKTLWWLWAGVVVVVAATAYGQIRLNRWNQPFYDALSHRELREFVIQLGRFALIAGSLLVLNVAQRWLGEMLKLKLREGLVQDLIQNWMQKRRAFRLAHAGPMGVNPDQRVHEDARHLTELSADLGIGLLQSSALLVIFVQVLWGLSRGFTFTLFGMRLPAAGYMVWAAIIYAGSASLLSYWVGRTLIDRNAERYAREAELRYRLVRVNEHVDAIALAGGEEVEAQRLRRELDSVLAAMRALVSGLTRLTWVTSGYGWFTLVAPILVAAPLYFAGSLSFGGLMMAAGAFTQVQSSLRWFVDNFSQLADWRATLIRVASFRRALIETEALHGEESRIDYVDGTPGRVVIADLEIASPSGCVGLAEKRVELRPAEHVLIVAEPGSGKTLMLRALAGLWPWGGGRIERSATEETLYVTRTPYVPTGTLREVLAYPRDPSRFEPPRYADALRQLGLERLVPQLDEAQRWDQLLSEDEQQALTFARVVLHAPPWVFIDDLLDALEPETLKHVVSTFSETLSQTAVVHVGHAQAGEPLGACVLLHLEKDPDTRRISRGEAPTDPPAQHRVAVGE